MYCINELKTDFVFFPCLPQRKIFCNIDKAGGSGLYTFGWTFDRSILFFEIELHYFVNNVTSNRLSVFYILSFVYSKFDANIYFFNLFVLLF